MKEMPPVIGKGGLKKDLEEGGVCICCATTFKGFRGKEEGQERTSINQTKQKK